MNIKRKLGAVAPKWVVRLYRKVATAREFVHDFREYAASSAWDCGGNHRDNRLDTREALTSRLTLAYHGIEKGASFPDPKKPYGLTKKADIATLLEYGSAHGLCITAADHAKSAVSALDQFNETGVISDEVTPPSNWGGREFEDDAIASFVLSRHSVRDFDQHKRVDPRAIHRAVDLASSTPSVCNRRAYRVYHLNEKGNVAKALSFQNGNLGFGHTVPTLLIVTMRRSSFIGAGERNQRWIDGGLFAMTLVWILHAKGLATCFLNWSQPKSQTDKLRSAFGIPTSEDVIVMIATGYAREGHRVARSPLRSRIEILVEPGNA